MSNDQANAGSATGAASGTGAGQGLRISDETAKAFKDLVDLIVHSKSMNMDERQYWIDLLPVMTREQLAELTSILTDEKQKLAAIDEKYAKELSAAEQRHQQTHMVQERKAQLEERRAQESTHEQEEREREEELMKKIQEL